ncbi:hypothetical protein B566_EDAN006354 [Ephemera danica]|nr:hypothetical protein B566_EDAN006354 [Ephemera danica]
MAASKANVLRLYKALLRESQKFEGYNFRNYALRRIRDAFKDNAQLSDSVKLKEEYQYGLQQLDVIKRQVIVGNLYKADKLVIERTPA